MYITKQDLVATVGAAKLARLSGDDDTTISAAIDRASGLINGMVAARYRVPLAPVPLVITGYCADIAEFYLWRDEAPAQVVTRYKDALTGLANISRGLMQLESVGIEDARASDEAQIVSDARTFTSDFGISDFGRYL